MQIFFSTVVRAAPVEKGGELIQLDWDSKTVLSRIPIAPKNPKIIDPNPRGNARGGRGIVMLNDEIFVASEMFQSLQENIRRKMKFMGKGTLVLCIAFD